MATGHHEGILRAILWACVVAALVVAGILLGSRGLKDFDTALVPYAGATVFAAFGLAGLIPGPTGRLFRGPPLETSADIL